MLDSRLTAFAAAALLCSSLCGCTHAPTRLDTAGQLDQDQVRQLLAGSTPFTRERLVPDAETTVYYESSVERQPRSVDGAPFMRSRGPMYVSYNLPLPQGAAAGETGGGIGILEMGKITPLVEWKPYGGRYSFIGWRGRYPVLMGPTATDRYVISGGRVIRVSDDIRFTDADVIGLSPDLGLPDGATCRVAHDQAGYRLESSTPHGAHMRLVDPAELDAALRDFETRPTVRAFCFRFAQRDFVEFYGYDTVGIIYRIDRGSLTLIGGGGISGGDENHVLMTFDDGDRRWFNEERSSSAKALLPK